MIKLIIFDLSGVCFTNEEPIYLEALCKKYGYDYKEFDDFYQSMLVKAEVGKMKGEELWSILIEKYKIPKTTAQIVDEMMELKEPKLDTLNFAKELKNKIKVIYLTNYTRHYWDAISKIFNMKKWFSSGFVSYQLGFRKPSIESFKFIMNKYKVSPKEVLFVDDSQKNLDSAKSLGINTILFNSVSQLKRDVKETIVMHNP